MDINEFVDSQYLEEIDREDYKYQDVWNPSYNPNGVTQRINTTGIELDEPYSSNRPIQTNTATAQIQPSYFHAESGRLLIPDATARRLAQDIYQELMARFDPQQMKEFASAAKRLMTGIHLNKEEVDNWIREFSPTLAKLYDEFVSLQRSEEDILDFGHSIDTILSTVLKAA